MHLALGQNRVSQAARGGPTLTTDLEKHPRLTTSSLRRTEMSYNHPSHTLVATAIVQSDTDIP